MEHKLYRCFYFYIDRATLLDESCEILCKFAGRESRAICLVLHDKSELQELKELEAFGYISDVLYGADLVECTVKDIENQHRKEKNCLCIGDVDAVEHPFVIGVGKQREYQDLAQFLTHYFKKERSVRNRIIVGIVSCILYFTFYFTGIFGLPDWMRQGLGSILTLLLPAVVLVTCVAYGIYRKVVSMWEVLDWI